MSTIPASKQAMGYVNWLSPLVQFLHMFYHYKNKSVI